MVPLYNACNECTLTCKLLHGNKDPSSATTSFFKVMFGESYSEVMFLPPRFARRVQKMVDKEIQLEDSSGQKWTVKLTWVDGSLAFHEGWNGFAEDHSLKVGDFLTFHYIAGSHFFVLLYGESGCPENRHFGGTQKLKKNFKKKGSFMPTDTTPSNKMGVDRRKKKKLKSKGEFGADDSRPSAKKTNGHDHSIASSSQSGAFVSHNSISQRCETLAKNMGNGGGKVNVFGETLKTVDPCSVVVAVTPSPCVMEPFYDFDRDNRNAVEESRRSCLHDLSAFENHRNQSDDSQRNVSPGGYKVCGYKQEEYRSSLLDLSFELQNNPSENVFNKHIKEPESLNNGAVNAHRSATPPTGKMKATAKELARATDEDNSIEAYRASNRTAKVAKKEPARTSSMDFLHSRANPMQVTKKEQLARIRDSDIREEKFNGYKPVDITAGGCSSGFLGKGHDQNFQVVKEEPLDLDDTPLPHFDDTSYLAVMDSTRYLELPQSFDSHIRRGRVDTTVIYLRCGADDPEFFPVLYENKHGFKILTTYWEAFARAHGFNLGDTCELKLENGSEGIFRVRVVPK